MLSLFLLLSYNLMAAEFSRLVDYYRKKKLNRGLLLIIDFISMPFSNKLFIFFKQPLFGPSNQFTLVFIYGTDPVERGISTDRILAHLEVLQMDGQNTYTQIRTPTPNFCNLEKMVKRHKYQVIRWMILASCR